MRHIRPYHIHRLFENDSDFELTLPKGHVLFHATGEEFDPGTLKPGAYDGVIWTAEDSAISQMYIPASGSTWYTRLGNLMRPSESKTIRNLQRKLGIEYDYSDIKFERGTPMSWSIPDAFAGMSNKEREDFFRERMKSVLGYETDGDGDGDRFDPYEIKTHKDEVMPADWKMKGRLFVIEVQEPLKIYDLTMGGRTEGDLMDLEYNKIDLFRAKEEAGYDGIKINDFAQSETMGNMGHRSIGIFPGSINKCTWEVVPDVVHPTDLDHMWQDRDWTSDEYREYKRLKAEMNKA